MTNLPPKLREQMIEFLDKHVEDYPDSNIRYRFRAAEGFRACWSAMAPLIEALKEIDSSVHSRAHIRCVPCKARDALKEIGYD